ncbi:hypothetical protein ACFL2H_11365 [Planctomycetota bacterium]
MHVREDKLADRLSGIINCGEKRARRVLCLHASSSIHRQRFPPGQGNDESTTCNLRSGKALAQASGTQIDDLASAAQTLGLGVADWGLGVGQDEQDQQDRSRIASILLILFILSKSTAHHLQE